VRLAEPIEAHRQSGLDLTWFHDGCHAIGEWLLPLKRLLDLSLLLTDHQPF